MADDEESGGSLGFRWPKAGDRLFAQSYHQHENADLNLFGFSRTWRMTSGYKMAADLMVERAAGNYHDKDLLVFPIIFNYRHFIELSLKSLIADYGPAVGVDANWKSHDLLVLWQTLQQIFELYGVDDPDDTDAVVEQMITEFAKVDPGSFSFRYPRDRNGNPIPLAHDAVDLAIMADTMKALEGYFSGCDGYLDSLKNAGP